MVIYQVPRWFIASIVAMLCLPHCGSTAWLVFASGIPVNRFALALGTVSYALWFVLGFAMSTIRQTVDHQGVKAFSMKFLAWSEVKSFRERRIAGLTYAEFVTHTGPNYLVLLSLPAGLEFRNAVLARARSCIEHDA